MTARGRTEGAGAGQHQIGEPSEQHSAIMTPCPQTLRHSLQGTRGFREGVSLGCAVGPQQGLCERTGDGTLRSDSPPVGTPNILGKCVGGLWGRGWRDACLRLLA